MSGQRSIHAGFTLIELMVTIAVMLVIMLLAASSFEPVRQRAATRGAGEEIVNFWNQARMESAKRNQLVKVGVRYNGGAFCLGAATTTSATDTTPCNCLIPSGGCDVAQFPGSQSEWDLVTIQQSTLGGSNWAAPSTGTLQPAIIEPKRTALAATTQAGTVTLSGPPGSRSYQLRFNVDRFGRGVLCEPSAAPDKLSDFNGRRC